MISKEWYVADFETTAYNYYLENGYTKVWLFAICDSDANVHKVGFSIDEFFDTIKKMYGKTIYFHNLKFDGEFIIYYLLSHGYQYVDDIKDTNRGFSILMGEMGEFYSMDIRFTKGKTVHIHDSLKLLPFKVAKIGKDFELPVQKTSIDYNDYTITDEKIEYVCNDVKVVALALNKIKAEGMTRMTTAGCAYNAYKSMRTKDYMEQCFPVLDDAFLDEWRSAYRGGRSQVNPIHQGKIVKNVKRYDINSMYPSIMYNERLPYGKPIPIKERNSTYFELYHVEIEFSLKDRHLPMLLKKGALYAKEDSYYIETDGVEDIWISNIDFELLLKHYDITYLKFITMWGFRTSTTMFKDYITKWYSKKNVDKGAKKAVDKFMLNCLYGKFGSNHKGYRKRPIIDEITGIVRYQKSELQDMTHYYLPMAIAITSYAHKYIDDAITETGYENFVYCDTDSVHTIGTLPDNMIDNKELGKFKLEAIETKSLYVRQKTYLTTENGTMHITCAGMTDDMKRMAIEKYGNDLYYVFCVGFSITGKLLPKHVPGGIVLYETTFQISA